MQPKDKLDSLLQRKAKLEQQIANIETRRKVQERKDDTRLKVLIGAALLADSKINPETDAFVRTVVEKAITAERDRAFLQSKGWVKAKKENAGQ